MSDWFNVDRKGLAQIVERRGKAAIVTELISNAFDQKVTEVSVTLNPIPGRAAAELTVTDDDPNGWTNLSHAYTLFAPSEKKTDAKKRGRFNLGEKLVLAFCEDASIVTTTGSVHFDDVGRSVGRMRRERGSEFSATIRLTRTEVLEVEAEIRRIIVPVNVKLTLNGEPILHRTPLTRFAVNLMTEIADEEGNMRRVLNQTLVEVFRTEKAATLYELGIPVVETFDTFDVNVMQKIPLNLDRDNVLPGFLRKLRAEVLNHAFSSVPKEDMVTTWVKEAVASGDASTEAVTSVMKSRFGEKSVAFDPSDPEANKLAVSQGYAVVHGGSLSADEWNAVRKTETLIPAGRVTPSSRAVFSASGGIGPLEGDKLTPAMQKFIAYAENVGFYLLGCHVEALIYPKLDPVSTAACFGSGRICFSLLRLGRRWFEEPAPEAMDALLIHEFAHHFEDDHLSSEYHDALCKLGAKLRWCRHEI